jgi:hypothetical protein
MGVSSRGLAFARGCRLAPTRSWDRTTDPAGVVLRPSIRRRLSSLGRRRARSAGAFSKPMIH